MLILNFFRRQVKKVLQSPLAMVSLGMVTYTTPTIETLSNEHIHTLDTLRKKLNRMSWMLSQHIEALEEATEESEVEDVLESVTRELCHLHKVALETKRKVK